MFKFQIPKVFTVLHRMCGSIYMLLNSNFVQINHPSIVDVYIRHVLKVLFLLSRGKTIWNQNVGYTQSSGEYFCFYLPNHIDCLLPTK